MSQSGNKKSNTARQAGEPMVRSGVLRGFKNLVTELGGDPCELLNQSRLPLAALDNEDLHVSSRSLALLLETAAAKLNCEDFGVRMACGQDLESAGFAAFIIQQYSTVADLLQDGWTEKLQKFQDQAVIDRIEIINNKIIYTFDHQFLDPVADTQGVYQAFAWVALMARKHLRPSPEVNGYYFKSKRPKKLDLFQEVFQADLYFSQDVNCISVDLSYLQQEIKIIHKTSKQQVDKYLGNFINGAHLDLTMKIKQLIFEYLPTGEFTLPVIAKALNQTPRAIQRHLQKEGLSYQQLLNDVRKEMAIRYMRAGNYTLVELSSILQYSTLSAFTRAFKSWYGVPPSEYAAGVDSDDPDANC